MAARHIFIFITLSALWGSSYLFMRMCVGYISPIAIAEFRLLIATLFIGLLLIFNPAWRKKVLIPKPEWPKLIVVAFLNSAYPFIVIAYTIQFVNAGTASILNATSPIWSALIATLWYREKMTLSRLFGLILGFMGVIVLMWGKAGFGADGLGLAIIAALSGTLCYGISSNYLKHSVVGIHPLSLTFWSMLIAALMLTIPALYQVPTAFPISAWVGILGLGIFATGIAYLLFFKLAEETSPSIAITTTFLVPVFSMLWGELFLDESVTLQMLLGALVVLGGTALAIGVISFGKPKTEAALPMD